MNTQELINKLQDIEWEDFEVKEAKIQLPKNCWETVSAFSNTAGGWLVLGIKKQGRNFIVQGINNPEKIESDFLTVLRGNKFNKKIIVKSKKYSIEGKKVLGFYIPSASPKDKPIYFNSLANTFIRTGSGDQRATHEEIDAMYRNSSFEEKDRELTDFTIKALDTDTVDSYRTYFKNINTDHRYNKLSTEKFLEKLQVLKNNKITTGGLLVFGKEDRINDIIPDFRIDYLEIMGTSYEDAPSRYQYRLPQEKNIFSYYFSIYERLIKKIDIPFRLKGAFRDENQPQVSAIREALVNLLMHADYFSNAKSRIRIFIDRIEFFNPGALPKDIKYIIKEDFSLPRNPTIAKIFRLTNLAENIGSGFHKMINGWKSYYKNKPEIASGFDYYKIMFLFGKKSKREGVSEGVSEGVKLLYEYIESNPGQRVTHFEDALKKPGKTIERWIKILRDRKKIKFEGSPKTGGYYIVKKKKG